MQEHIIKPIFWLWIPIICMVGQLSAEMLISNQVLLEFHGENGPHEWFQIGLLIGVFWVACRCYLMMDDTHSVWLRLWVLTAVLGSFYVAGEEISWGQSIFQWNTPETWRALNYQNETNLHNISRLFNQIPRLFLEVGVIGGGVIIPLLRWLKPAWLPKRFAVIYPPTILSVTAVIYVTGKFSHKASKVFFDTKIFQRSSEVEELYLYFFVLLYLIYFLKALGHKKVLNI